MTDLSDVYKFIEQADLKQCSTIAAVFGNRLFKLEKQYDNMTGVTIREAADLMADVLLDLSQAAEEEKNDLLCAQCNGSGEGMHERTSCYFCKGAGTIRE